VRGEEAEGDRGSWDRAERYMGSVLTLSSKVFSSSAPKREAEEGGGGVEGRNFLGEDMMRRMKGEDADVYVIPLVVGNTRCEVNPAIVCCYRTI
jgi:hypothetical protein